MLEARIYRTDSRDKEAAQVFGPCVHGHKLPLSIFAQ